MSSVSSQPRGPGRPSRDQLVVLAQVVVARENDPDASIRSMARELRVRRESIRAALRLLAADRGRVPNPQSRVSEDRSSLAAPVDREEVA